MKKPYIIIYSTISLDGRLASRSGFSKLSCKFDKKRQMILRCNSDAIVIGGNTARIDNPLLTVREIHCDHQPIRVIISHSLTFEPTLKIFRQPPQTFIYTDNENAASNRLSEACTIIKLKPFSICSIMNDLYIKGVRKVLIEGGGNLIFNTIKEGCYDEIRITISPYLMGDGVNFLNGKELDLKKPSVKLIDTKLCECKNEVHIIYKKI
ncbi:dihydrofolate reductase family protein [Sulfuracidifex metallicus]|uniref:dihydrofolate reductase family protein n=1 Tax=Sulfuracidifex metallicus TaxID=47303 RepID=UPI00227553BE|nr:dihydrofolate reductase family protein [Sulfuracidifex metallicus]MCY0850165.1 dihydrofolate reductase family protein [Sulfuracidifex metallicus]